MARSRKPAAAPALEAALPVAAEPIVNAPVDPIEVGASSVVPAPAGPAHDETPPNEATDEPAVDEGQTDEGQTKPSVDDASHGDAEGDHETASDTASDFAGQAEPGASLEHATGPEAPTSIVTVADTGVLDDDDDDEGPALRLYDVLLSEAERATGKGRPDVAGPLHVADTRLREFAACLADAIRATEELPWLQHRLRHLSFLIH